MTAIPTIAELATPVVLLDRPRMEKNIRAMQEVCHAHGVELWPHIKTHKMVEVARRQLAAGARGLTCAKVGEAEAMLPSGVKRIFIAHSLVDVRVAPRLAALADQLDELRVAATSVAQTEALVKVAVATNRTLQVMLAVDTGLHREGVREVAAARAVAAIVADCPQLKLVGIYTHEGQIYGAKPEEQAAQAQAVLDRVSEIRDAIDPALPLCPGCSVTARMMAATGRVQVVRPGAYMFGDMALAVTSKVMTPAEVAIHVLVTVVDRPEPGLALIDAGSKVFSSDKTALGVHAMAVDGRDIQAVRLNEEHGYLRGADVDALKIGDRLQLMPAHVCPVINLTDFVTVVAGDSVEGRWSVDARGKVQ
ncbi:MAG: alanine racemase [Cephaloticoccus sp.]|nr:alanine racemase [Cephaloticoccus sp.]MCF7759371.1 alanine racemase [Cephaloticoccus sp.]